MNLIILAENKPIKPTITPKDHRGLPIETDPKEEERREELRRLPKKPVYDGVKWWLPFECGKKNTIVSHGQRFGMGCGSRSCLTCHQKKMRKSVSAVGDLKRYKNSGMYSCVFSPSSGRIKSHDDVNDFLTKFRGMLRRWQRSHGLHFGYWVAECVVKDDEPPTDIICPVRTGNNPLPNDITNKIFEDCTTGGNCPICRGRGYLPSVHLHIHLVVCSEPFWYGDGSPPEKLKGWLTQDFAGMGWNGFKNDCGMGWCEVQTLRERGGMAQYITKACLKYITKACKETGKETKDVDWYASQRGTMISSYIYGSRRHRGACGDSYGLLRKSRDYTNFISFDFRPPPNILRNSCDVFRGDSEPPNVKKEGFGGGRYVDVMEMGKKAQATVLAAAKRYSVLKETELDMVLPHEIYIRDSWEDDMGCEHNHFRQAERLSSTVLCSKWLNTPAVGKYDVWFSITNEYLIFGRGGTMLSVPVEWYEYGGLTYLHYILDFVDVFDYREWIELLIYPFDE
jgi:hypothetical protein